MLLPNAGPKDSEIAGEFRRLTESDLRATKISQLDQWWRLLTAEGEKITVTPDQFPAVMMAVNAIRQVVAVRLAEARADSSSSYDRLPAAEFFARIETTDNESDQRVWALAGILDMLTQLQGYFLDVLTTEDGDA